jgi:thiol-disulfide isomerase/thioredoxin
MQKKVLIFIGVVVLLFGALIFVVTYQNNQALEDNDNPYGTTDLEQPTVDLLGDPNYDNIIQPEDLNEQVDSGEEVTVYFFSPTCQFCMETTPYLKPLAEENGIDMKQFNLLEFGQEGNRYAIESTPTLIHYEDGEEVARIVGQRSEEEFQSFFDEYVHN